jgi:hypothetical protein
VTLELRPRADAGPVESGTVRALNVAGSIALGIEAER